ncbi:MAG: alpha/beta fold hydrolase [Flavobacteriales bacterium]|nr:alpha/beta fold hydrolase [Flavobacteriales bacterium]
MHVYLLPGLATDKRLFSGLRLKGFEVRVLEWPTYRKGEGLPDIAARMAPLVDADRPHVLAGVSMGGMVAQELAALTKPRHVVLISSVTGPQEFPLLLHLGRGLALYHGITDGTIRLTRPFRRFFGTRDAELASLLHRMAMDQGGLQIRRGARAILHWQGPRWQGPVTRIHGDADRLLPMRAPADHVVRGGTHPMVLTRAGEVDAILGRVLRGIVEGEAEMAS